VRQGYSIVPHAWVSEKLATDCHRCSLFRRCGQTAVQLSLVARSREEKPLVLEHATHFTEAVA
jgi:hypothetical protein